jgi:histidinol dehydrogenase
VRRVVPSHRIDNGMMEVNKLIWSAMSADEREGALRRPTADTAAAVAAEVAGILSQVRAEGDVAVRRLTRELDGVQLHDLAVTAAERREAMASLERTQRDALEQARSNLIRFHEAQLTPPLRVETMPGVVCERVRRPIGAVGLYVPAGSAPLPSAVLMLGVPSALAGCPLRVLCAPPRPDGRMDPSIVAAAQLCGIEHLFKIGGAQAIAAMAYGTATVPRTHKIFGPGNAWVTAAKRAVASGDDGAAVDMPAGPSEVLVIADADADAGFVAADLLSQAEHGPDSQVMLITPDDGLADAVITELEHQLGQLSRSGVARQSIRHARIIVVDTLEEAVAVSNRYAPEHLIVQTADPRRLVDAITDAGSVFLGRWSPEAIGDYCSGTNHVLPTYGHARAWSGLSVDAFVKQVTMQELTADGLSSLGPTAVTLADMEGLDAHGLAVSRRLDAIAAGAR